MRNIIFQANALEHYNYWCKTNSKIQTKIADLLKAILTDPFEGIGKPEALKHNLKGYWSRRINKEHRLVYQVTEDAIIVISCKYHY